MNCDKNVIIFNLPETLDKNANKQYDESLVQKLYLFTCGIDILDFKCFRLGRQTNSNSVDQNASPAKPRPLKAAFTTVLVKSILLSNCNKLG